MDPKQEVLDLRAQVEKTVGVETSAKALIDGFADRLTAAIDQQDWDLVKGLNTELQTSSDALAASVAANPVQPPQ